MKKVIITLLFLTFFQLFGQEKYSGYIFTQLIENVPDHEYLSFTADYKLRSRGEVFFVEEQEFLSLVAKESFEIEEIEYIILDPSKEIGIDDFIKGYFPSIELPNTFGLLKLYKLDFTPVIEIGEEKFVFHKIEFTATMIDSIILEELFSEVNNNMKVLLFQKLIRFKTYDDSLFQKIISDRYNVEQTVIE